MYLNIFIKTKEKNTNIFTPKYYQYTKYFYFRNPILSVIQRIPYNKNSHANQSLLFLTIGRKIWDLIITFPRKINKQNEVEVYVFAI